jgi:hypothetical protein
VTYQSQDAIHRINKKNEIDEQVTRKRSARRREEEGEGRKEGDDDYLAAARSINEAARSVGSAMRSIGVGVDASWVSRPRWAMELWGEIGVRKLCL